MQLGLRPGPQAVLDHSVLSKQGTPPAHGFRNKLSLVFQEKPQCTLQPLPAVSRCDSRWGSLSLDEQFLCDLEQPCPLLRWPQHKPPLSIRKVRRQYHL